METIRRRNCQPSQLFRRRQCGEGDARRAVDLTRVSLCWGTAGGRRRTGSKRARKRKQRARARNSFIHWALKERERVVAESLEIREGKVLFLMLCFKTRRSTSKGTSDRELQDPGQRGGQSSRLTRKQERMAVQSDVGAEPYVCGSRARATEIRQEEGRCAALTYGRERGGRKPERRQTQCPLPRDGVKGGESEGLVWRVGAQGAQQ